jgi:HD-GYP domain-containing protein (c-di-GMP phosphodiesterase class II)
MKFVRTDELKAGMRLAKPIYNKTGVLLYERDSQLTTPGIKSIRNFGLIGVYILEPAEPAPPLSEEDIKFEQYQTMYMFRLRECTDRIMTRKKMEDLVPFLEDILKHYGALDHRVNFNQNLRSADDFMYKHAISTAVLVAMMTSHLRFTHTKQLSMVAAALFYDIGYRYVPKAILEKGDDLEQGDQDIIQQSLEQGLNFLPMYQNDYDFMPQAIVLCTAYIYSTNPNRNMTPDDDISEMMMILKIADQFDRRTAMNLGHEPESEIMAMKYLKTHPRDFTPSIVSVLAECIHIVPHAASVDLSTGDKGIVLAENPEDFMHPVILRLSDNQIYDLSKPADARKIQIVDIMKTMDNRVVLDKESLKQFKPDSRLKSIVAKFKRKRAERRDNS